MCGMQTGLVIPKLVDTAHEKSSFVKLYCSVGMTLANIVECRSRWTHARYTGLAGFRALILRSSLSAIAFTICLHSVFWVCASGVPSTELPARSGGQLSGVSICVGSNWVPSPAICWHVAQFTSKAAPTLVCRAKRGFIPNNGPPVARLILSSKLSGKSDVRAGVWLLSPRFLTSALPMPRLVQSMTQATRPAGAFATTEATPNPPSLLGSLILSTLQRTQLSLIGSRC